MLGSPTYFRVRIILNGQNLIKVTNTNEVFDIETVDLDNDYNTCEREFIELPDGTELELDLDFTVNEER